MDFKRSLKNINDYLFKVNIDNNVSNIVLNNSFTTRKEQYADNYIFNAIVNHADYFFKKNSKKYHTLNEDDILREIFLNEYKKNKQQTRATILENYLSNTVKTQKYKNRYRVRNAIRNINNEMEEAQKEFSKLFQTDNSYSKSY